MAEFTMEIAGTAIAVSSRFSSTQEYFRKYLTEREHIFSVCPTPEELVSEQQLLDAEADREGLRRRVFTDPFLERAAIQRAIAGFVLRQNIILLHGSTIAVDGKAYLFTAACGIGKSTHTRLWRELLGSRAVMVNDDRAFLKIEESVTAYGSPWSGKHGIDNNISAPLGGICILARGTENRIEPMPPEAALPILKAQIFQPGEDTDEKLEVLTAALIQRVPLWQMACTKDIAAARMAFETMT